MPSRHQLVIRPGVPPFSSTRRTLLLPRSLTPVINVLTKLNTYRRAVSRLSRVVQNPLRTIVAKSAQRPRRFTNAKLREIYKTLSPTYHPGANPCLQRKRRKQVMFSLQVAGRSWGSGSGPNMKNAQRSIHSQRSC